MIHTLLKRELGGLWVLFILLVFGVGPYLVAVGIDVGWDRDAGQDHSPAHILQYGDYRPVPFDMLTGFYVPLLALPVLAALLAVLRQWLDRRSHESAFLVGEGATRNRIFATRVLAGVVMFGLIIAAIAAGFAVILRGHLRAVEGAWLVLGPRFAVLAVYTLATYFIGLWLGQHERVFLAVCGAIIASALTFLLILVKGFTPEAIVWLALVAAGALLGAWATYRHQPL